MEDREPFSQSIESAGPPVDHRGLIVKRRLPVGRAESLEVMSGEYAYFTLAALYLYGWLSDVYLIDHMHEQGHDVPIYCYKFDRPVFGGLATVEGDADWNHAIMAVRQEHWQPLLDFLCSLTIAHRDAGVALRYGQQLFNVLDPLHADRAVILQPNAPRVVVSALGVYGSRFLAAFRIKHGVPTLGFLDPDEADIVAARAYFAGVNPLNAREQYHLKDQP